jgi:hypothetical protein
MDDIIIQAYDSCPRIHIKDTTNMNNINLHPIYPCSGNSQFRPKQTNGIDANCLIDSLIDNLTRYVNENRNSQLAKSVNFNHPVRPQIENLLKFKCSGKDPVHVVGISSTVVPVCDARVIQGATDLSSCMINSVTDMVLRNRKIRKKEDWTFVMILFLFSFFAMIYILFLK